MQMITDRIHPANLNSGPGLLSVGLSGALAASLSGGKPVRQVSADDLPQMCRGASSPMVVACPLMWDAHDALCVITQLKDAGFQGTLLVITPPLPNPGMVERELRSAARGLSLRLVPA